MIKFFIKSFIVVILVKLFDKNYLDKKNSNACISLFPNFYNNNKETFFNDRNINKLNFLISDETHLGHSLNEIYKIIKKKNFNNFINIEKHISLYDLVTSFLKSLYYINRIRKINFELKINNHNFENYFKNKIYKSLINRLKLSIYDNALFKVINIYNLKRINLYLFEYNFGFYLIRRLREISNKIKIIGYQHGIFYKNLLWLEVISKIRFSEKYFPNEIYAFNKNIIKDYKTFYGTKYTKFNIKNKKISEISKQIKFSKNNNILVIAGLHDGKIILKEITDNLKRNKISQQNHYYIKFHPKQIINIKNNIKFSSINKLGKIKFKKILISPSSSIAYDLLKLNKKFYIFDTDYKINYVDKDLSKINFN